MYNYLFKLIANGLLDARALSLFHHIPNPEDPAFSPTDFVNTIFRNYVHQYAHDYDKLSKILFVEGFTSVRRCVFRQGLQPNYLVDTESRRHESLYVEAV
jgi:hypothetical protein